MLLLVTIGLVVVGAISLVIGFVTNTLAWIYISIVCSLIAGVVLVLFSRRNRQTVAPADTAGPAPLREPVTDEPTAAVMTPAASASSSSTAGAIDFPIEGYDDLRVNQILPLLPSLDLDELDLVREREEAGKNRATIITKVDERITILEDEEDAIEDDEAAIDEEEVADDVAAEAAQPVASASATDGMFPIADYDDLSVAEILPLLDELDDDELEMVADREEQGSNRATIIKRIDAIFEEPAPTPAAKSPAKKAATATRAPVKKAPAKKAPAKKAAAKTTKRR